MNVYETLSAIAGILFVLAFVPYALAILRGQTKPKKSSWLIWAVVDTIALIAMFKEGVTNWQMIGAVCGVWTIVVLALKFGESGGWNLVDKICIGIAALGVLLWVAFDNALVGMFASLTAIFVGAIPTFIGAWNHPDREDGLAWTIFWASCLFQMAAISVWTPKVFAQPVVFTVIETVMMYLVFVRSGRLRRFFLGFGGR